MIVLGSVCCYETEIDWQTMFVYRPTAGLGIFRGRTVRTEVNHQRVIENQPMVSDWLAAVHNLPLKAARVTPHLGWFGFGTGW